LPLLFGFSAGRFVRQRRLQFLDAITVALFDAGVVLATKTTSDDEQVLVLIELLRVAPRQLQHDPAIYRRQVLIQLAELTSSLVVEKSGVSACRAECPVRWSPARA